MVEQNAAAPAVAAARFPAAPAPELKKGTSPSNSAIPTDFTDSAVDKDVDQDAGPGPGRHRAGHRSSPTARIPLPGRFRGSCARPWRGPMHCLGACSSILCRFSGIVPPSSGLGRIQACETSPPTLAGAERKSSCPPPTVGAKSSSPGCVINGSSAGNLRSRTGIQKRSRPSRYRQTCGCDEEAAKLWSNLFDWRAQAGVAVTRAAPLPALWAAGGASRSAGIPWKVGFCWSCSSSWGGRRPSRKRSRMRVTFEVHRRPGKWSSQRGLAWDWRRAGGHSRERYPFPVGRTEELPIRRRACLYRTHERPVIDFTAVKRLGISFSAGLLRTFWSPETSEGSHHPQPTTIWWRS